jgi:hypothetical protein
MMLRTGTFSGIRAVAGELVVGVRLVVKSRVVMPQRAVNVSGPAPSPSMSEKYVPRMMSGCAIQGLHLRAMPHRGWIEGEISRAPTGRCRFVSRWWREGIDAVPGVRLGGVRHHLRADQP